MVFNVYTLVGGYKAYRKWVNEVFNQPYTMKVLGGFTGSNKTGVLETMETKGLAVINLEGLANHKGSAFGGIGQEPQPTQEMFENKLAMSLAQINPGIGNNEPCWIEDESQRIGVLTIPHPLWKTLRQQTVFFIEIPFEERLRFIVENYGSLNKEKLVNAIIRIQKRLVRWKLKLLSDLFWKIIFWKLSEYCLPIMIKLTTNRCRIVKIRSCWSIKYPWIPLTVSSTLKNFYHAVPQTPDRIIVLIVSLFPICAGRNRYHRLVERNTVQRQYPALLPLRNRHQPRKEKIHRVFSYLVHHQRYPILCTQKSKSEATGWKNHC
jgi:hypothetical protein